MNALHTSFRSLRPHDVGRRLGLLVVGVAVAVVVPIAVASPHAGHETAAVSATNGLPDRAPQPLPDAVPVASTAPAPAPPATSPVAMQYGPEAYHVLDLRRPDPIAYPGPRPVIVYVHAGGWVAGDRRAIPDLAIVQVARGYALASVDYRLAAVAPDGQSVASFPGAIWDVKRAIRYLKANAAALDLSPRQVILMGASAGGHLAAFVGATPGLFEPPDLPTTADKRRDSSVNGIVDFVGPTDLESFERTDLYAAGLTAAFLGCPPASALHPLTCPDAIVREASVAPYVDSTDPAIFLAYGALDTLVVPATQGLPLASAWIAAHGGNTSSASYDLVLAAGHNLSLTDASTPLAEFLDRVAHGQLHD